MKYSILLVFCLNTFFSFGQVNRSIPPEASIFYNKAIHIISPEIRNCVTENAIKISNSRIPAEQLLSELKKEARLKKLSKADLDWIAILIMVQANKNTDEEIKRKVVELRKDPGQEGIEEIKQLSELKSFLAGSTTLLLERTTISQENVLNKLKP